MTRGLCFEGAENIRCFSVLDRLVLCGPVGGKRSGAVTPGQDFVDVVEISGRIHDELQLSVPRLAKAVKKTSHLLEDERSKDV